MKRRNGAFPKGALQVVVASAMVAGALTATTASATAEPAASPRLVLEMWSAPSDADSFVAGQSITYKFGVANAGDGRLSGVQVETISFTGSGELSEITCPTDPEVLEPAGGLRCSVDYTLTDADIEAGEVRYAAAATALPEGAAERIRSNEASYVVPYVAAPSLTLEKTATWGDFEVGEQIEYSYAVTNTGNIRLVHLFIREQEFTGTGEPPAAVCPEEALLPTLTAVCTATYTITEGDVEAGFVDNTATALGGWTTVEDDGFEESDPSSVTVPTPMAPALELVKTASPSDPAKFAVGTEVTYSFEVTNSGDVPVSGVRIDEVDFTGSGELSKVTCPTKAESIEPGEGVTCYAEYKLTQADIDAGRVDNVAQAIGTDPRDNPVESGESSASLTGDPASGSVDIPIVPVIGGLGSLALGSLALGSVDLPAGSSGSAEAPAGSSEPTQVAPPAVPETPVAPPTPGAPTPPADPGTKPRVDTAPQGGGTSGQQPALIDAGLGANGESTNGGMIGAGIALLVAAGGVVGWALLRRRNSLLK